MDTKLKADIAESSLITELLRRGFKVLKPIGDRLAYDLAIDINGKLVRLQVKSAWFDKSSDCFIVDVRRTKTNRRRMVRQRYDVKDFDFAIVYLDVPHVFYIMPVSVFVSFGSTISFVETDKRQRKPKSAEYKGRWDLLSQWAHQSVTVDGSLSNSVKPEKVIPSQVRQADWREGVETRRQAPEATKMAG